MTTIHREHRRLVESQMLDHTEKQSMCVNDLFDALRRQVVKIREQDSTLDDYHLYDMKVQFDKSDIRLQFDFRK